jgi:hypothetical protein
VERILPIVARLRAKFFGNLALSACATEIIELAPAVDREQLAAIALPDEFDRVIAVQEDTDIKLELERIREGTRRHGPTVAYRIDNAVLGQGSLYFDGGYQGMRGGSKRPLLPRHKDCFAEMQLCTNYVIGRYFGHWIIDGLVLELLAAQRSLPGLTFAGTQWPHEPGYRELCRLEITRSDHARVERLWVIDDRGINDGWISRIEELRRRVRLTVIPNGAKRVLLTRGTLGAARNLVNSPEVYNVLDQLGFEILNAELETPRSIVEKLSAVEIAVAVEGSGVNHCFLAMPSRSTIVTIQPPTRFNSHGKVRCDVVGVNWAFVVATPHPEGFCLPIERLLRTIDEVVRVTGARA